MRRRGPQSVLLALAKQSTRHSYAHAIATTSALVGSRRQQQRHQLHTMLTEAPQPWQTPTVCAASEDQVAPIDKTKNRAALNWDMKLAIKRNDRQAALKVWKQARDAYPGVPVLSLENCNSLLFMCRHKMPVKRVMVLLNEMIKFDRVSLRSFNTVLVACSNARDLDRALEVCEMMRAQGKVLGAFAYTNLIACCASAKSVDLYGAESLWSDMSQDNVQPTIETLNVMLRVYKSTTHQSMKALELTTETLQKYGLKPDSITISTLVKSLLQDGRLREAVEFVTRTKSNGFPVEAAVCNAIVDACRRDSLWEEALSVASLVAKNDKDSKRLVALCRDQDSESTAMIWNSYSSKDNFKVQNPRKLLRMLTQHLKQGTLDADKAPGWKDWERILLASAIEDVKFFFDMAHARFEQLSDTQQQLFGLELHNIYLYALAKADAVDEAVSVLCRMREKKIVSSTSFDNVLVVCGRLGRLEEAERVLSLMKHDLNAHPPTILSYNSILNACAFHGDVDKAEMLYQELRCMRIRPDVVTLNTMLKIYSNASKQLITDDELEGNENNPSFAVRALDFFHHACQYSYPDGVTYSSLFRILALDVHGDIESAEEEEKRTLHASFIMDVCQNADVETLNTEVFNGALDFCQRYGNVDMAFKLFNMMKARGIQRNVSTLHLLFAACSRKQQADVGLNLMNYLLQEEGYSPKLAELNGLIQLCASSERPADAVAIFDGIQASGLFKPDAKSYAHVVHAFARVGDVSNALKYIHSMKEDIECVNIEVYNDVLRACTITGDRWQAMGAYKLMVEHEGLVPNNSTFDTLLRSFTTKKSVGSFGDDRDEFEEDDEDEEFEILGDASDDEGVNERIDEILWDILAEMDKFGVSSTPNTYKHILIACAIRDDHNALFAFFDNLMAHSNVDIVRILSETSLLTYMDSCVHCKDANRIKALVKQLRTIHNQTHRLDLSPVVVVRLLGALETVGELHEAMGLLRNLESDYGVAPNVAFFNSVMEMCNNAQQPQYVDQIFLTMQQSAAYRLYPNVESYVQAISALEQRNEWVRATNLFMEMQKKCSKEDLSPKKLQKIAIGRYSEERKIF